MLWKLLLAVLPLFQGSSNPGFDSQFTVINSQPALGKQPWEPQTPQDEEEARKALHNDHEGGDMILPPGMIYNSISNLTARWPGYPGKGVVPYVIDPSIDAKYYDIIQRAMDQYTKLTCVKFVQRKKEVDYINFAKKNGCYSYVGRIGGPQTLSLGKGCYYIGTIVHELGHAIGFVHEHQRSDRDQYINVYDRNATASMIRNFVKTKTKDEIIFNGFDYNSIMIYGNYAFSKSPKKLMTMEARNGIQLTEPYNKPGLDNSDIDRVNKMYVCKKVD